MSLDTKALYKLVCDNSYEPEDIYTEENDDYNYDLYYERCREVVNQLLANYDIYEKGVGCGARNSFGRYIAEKNGEAEEARQEQANIDTVNSVGGGTVRPTNPYVWRIDEPASPF